MPRIDGLPETGAETEAVQPEVGEDRSGWIALPAGEALTLSESSVLTFAAPTRLTILVGERRVGKTTLMAEIHNAFLAGPIGEETFAGSRTLPAFESRGFRARLKSRRDRPETTRTSLASGVRLLHVAARNMTTGGPARDLLLGDTSGEAFSAMRTRREEVDALAPLLRRADSVILLVDGARIAQTTHAQKTRTNARTLFRAMLEGNALTAESVVHVAVTKWDAVALAAAEHTARALFEEIANSFSTSVRLLSCHELAARPNPKAGLDRFFGIEKLFGALFFESPNNFQLPAIPPPANVRSYLRFSNGSSLGAR